MCIILTCEPTIRPCEDLLNSCLFSNPDGAGIAWVENGAVQISKGYSDVSALMDIIHDVPTESPLIIHARIATSGGISAGTCHPFPVCDSLDGLHAPDVECGAALAHNGIIRGIATNDSMGVSDTVAFVRDVVTPLWRKNRSVTTAVRKAIASAAPSNRFAILSADGTVSRIGRGWGSVSRGIEASNDSWRLLYPRHVEFDECDFMPYGWSDSEMMDSVCEWCDAYEDCKAWGRMCDNWD